MKISFAMANYNGDRFLESAVASALAQRGVAVEVLIVDDRSTDSSWALAQALASADPRVRAFQLPENRGPAGARNLALEHATGDWFAVLDNDDLIHPDRSLRMVEAAQASDATMVADDLLVFAHDGAAPPTTFLERHRTRDAQWITLPDYLRESVMYGPHPNLGFLKPMFRLDFLRAQGLAYDERLRIAEDDDLVVRALLAGGRYRLLPRPMYFYRKHGTSISHRLSSANADRMMAAADRLHPALAAAGADAAAAERRRRGAMRTARGFTHLVDALKARDLAAALRVAAATPSATWLLRQPLAAAVRRLFARRTLAPPVRLPNPRAVLFVSRQRLVGATNGSSAYLIAIAEAVRAAGMVPHLIQPSPGLFGRTPFFRLRPEMAVFETIRIRGSLAFGEWRITREPGVFVEAARGILARLLRRAGIGGPLAAERKAPYAIAAPWTSADLRYLASEGRGVAPTVIADYVFQTEAFPYLLDPGQRTALVMHDLFSARADQFTGGSADSVAAMTREQEIALLGRADAVLAIQAAEAAFVAANVPGTRAILAPMAARTVPTPQPGDPAIILFVGSNTAPNVFGLRWFIEQVWPQVRSVRPDARLVVAGTVAAAVEGAPGVELRGLVPDLAPLYAEAGVVVSPLLQGSGLKIKLIEALAHGKASVVTSVTLQGVEDILTDAVIRTDDAAEFAAAILRLQASDAERTDLATRALAAAARHFGPDAAFADFRAWLMAAG